MTTQLLEDQLAERGRVWLRQLYQDHLDLRADREARLPEVVDAAGVPGGPSKPVTNGC